MLFPVLLARPTVGMSHAMPGSMDPVDMPLTRTNPPSILVHTTTMLIVAGSLALVFFEFYDKVGLKMLRHTWFNFDLLWAFALLVAACAVLLQITFYFPTFAFFSRWLRARRRKNAFLPTRARRSTTHYLARHRNKSQAKNCYD